MTTLRWFAVADEHGKVLTTDDCVPVEADFIASLRRAVRKRRLDLLEETVECRLRVHLNRASFQDPDTSPLYGGTRLGSLGLTPEEAFVVQITDPAEWVVASRDPRMRKPKIVREERWNKLLDELVWNEPKRLCEAPGRKWPYQVDSTLTKTLSRLLVKHYDAWRVESSDKYWHTLPLIAGGPGSGKSRMLDEMPKLLAHTVKDSGRQDLIGRINQALVFKVDFGGDTAMMAKGNPSWEDFVAHMLASYHADSFRTALKIPMILSDWKQVKGRDVSMILCVDGLDNVPEGPVLGSILKGLRDLMNDTGSFSVCACAATSHGHLNKRLESAGQPREHLFPPAIDGHRLSLPHKTIARQLIDDMGGYGRALEMVAEVLCRHKDDRAEDLGPVWV